MIDYGVYSSNIEDTIADAKVAGGLVVTSNKTLIKETDEVEADVGTSFGFRYMLEGPNDEIPVTIKVIHPNPIKDPDTGKEIAVSEWGQFVPSNFVNWNTGWSFGSEWEIVPGEWLIQLYIDDRKVLEKKFTVLRAPPVIDDVWPEEVLTPQKPPKALPRHRKRSRK